MNYLFFLGHQPLISAAEIKAVFSYKRIKAVTLERTDTFVLIEAADKLDCGELIKTLGGTTKIAEKIDSDIISHLLAVSGEGKIEFSVVDKKRGLELKKKLRQHGRSARYIEPKNTATILHHNLIKRQSDFTVVEDGVFVTRAIQDIENFSERDYGRPCADDKSGMLPPKLARIMINLGITDFKDVLLDPFCGSGTILTEAISVGIINVIGSDISPTAISDTKKNIDWLIKTYKLTHLQTYTLHNINVLNLADVIKPSSVDAIITEPHLGKPLRGRETREFLVQQARELAELYLNAFHVFHKLLKPGGAVVMVFPKFQYKNEWIRVEILEKIKKIGFTDLPPLVYHRPTQHLAREIWRFKKV